MDAAELRNRTVSTMLAAFGAAATTATFLYMFQESSEVVKPQIGSAQGGKKLGTTGKTLISKDIPQVGDASALFPDFVGGLNGMALKAKSLNSHGLGKKK